MKRREWLAVVAAGLLAGAAVEGREERDQMRQSIQVTSTAFSEGATIPRQHTCEGANVSPPLRFAGLPAGAASLAVICEDPDAPSGTFTHWVMFNIPPHTAELAERVAHDEALPDGSAQGRNDFGKVGYGGPCPPPGKPHHYHFKVYALDAMLKLGPGTTRAQLLAAMKSHHLGEGQLTGTFGRQHR